MHTIRLRHPWQCQAYESGTRWLRSFHWTADLTDGETARLVVDGLPGSAKVQLNERLLTGGGTFDITSALARYNRLAIEVPDAEPTTQTQCPYDVRLEIVEP